MYSREIKQGRTFVVRLLSGADILTSLTDFLKKHKIASSMISGIGAVSKARIGFFDGKEYLSIEFNENLEILTCSGNSSLFQEEPFPHLHIVLGKKNGEAYGGHLQSGCIIGATGEFFIIEVNPPIYRDKDEETGLSLLQLS
ncbi:MAG: PPC domain-containing DNA-binding protein [Candidatus Hodarchaeota archaeon]